MPLYNFQLRTGSHFLVSESVDLPTAEDARVQAAHRAVDMFKEHSGKLRTDQDWCMEVTDAEGLILFVIHNL